MDKPKDDQPAFPVSGSHHGEMEWHHGMSLRDYFAGQALAGYPLPRTLDGDAWPSAWMVVQWAYEIADAMLAERAKVKG